MIYNAELHKFTVHLNELAIETNRKHEYFDIFSTYLSFTFMIFFFFNTIFVSSHMYPENPEGTQVIVGSMNMGYISDTARNRTHDLFRPSGSRYH